MPSRWSMSLQTNISRHTSADGPSRYSIRSTLSLPPPQSMQTGTLPFSARFAHSWRRPRKTEPPARRSLLLALCRAAALKSQLGGDGLHRVDYQLNVRVQLHPEVGGP